MTMTTHTHTHTHLYTHKHTHKHTHTWTHCPAHTPLPLACCPVHTPLPLACCPAHTPLPLAHCPAHTPLPRCPASLLPLRHCLDPVLFLCHLCHLRDNKILPLIPASSGPQNRRLYPPKASAPCLDSAHHLLVLHPAHCLLHLLLGPPLPHFLFIFFSP